MNEYNQSGPVFVPSEINVADDLDFWMDEYCRNNCKPATIMNYEKKICLHIKPAIGRYRLASLTPEAIQKLVNDKFKDGYRRNTLAVPKGILTGSRSYAVQSLKYIQVNPARYMGAAVHSRHSQKEILELSSRLSAARTNETAF